MEVAQGGAAELGLLLIALRLVLGLLLPVLLPPVALNVRILLLGVGAVIQTGLVRGIIRVQGIAVAIIRTLKPRAAAFAAPSVRLNGCFRKARLAG